MSAPADAPRPLPEQAALEAELARVKRGQQLLRTVRSAVCTVITVAAAAVLVSTLWLPVLRVTGASMAPTLQPGDIVVAVKGSRVGRGDLIAFYHNNRVLVKRVVALPGESVNMDVEGTLFINEAPQEEPYLAQKAAGEWEVSAPCTVPDGEYFVLGDARELSMDSRSSEIGTVDADRVEGRLAFRLWPLSRFGPVM